VTFTLACGDVMPGRSARFEAGSREALLGMVAPHAADAHGIDEITPEVGQAVDSKIVVR
jgi:predicted small metal-binding protein